MSRVAVVYNPIAGGSRGEGVSARVAQRLEEAGHAVERMPTRDRRGAAPVVAGVANGVDLVVAVGGDGTLREAAEGLGDERSRVVLGVVPMGNANVVAHELGIPGQTEAAIDVLLGGAPAAFDLGRVSGDGFESAFLAVVGIGWDADTVRLMDRLRHGPLGRHGYRVWADGLYGAAGLAAALNPRPVRFTVDADDERVGRDYCAGFFCNVRTYGKKMAVAPRAHRASGELHAQLRKSALPPALVWQLAAALGGREVPSHVSDYVDARTFSMRAARPFPVQVDGDGRGHSRTLTLTVEPGAIRILAPS